jgi:predicted aspartyl protease
VKRKLAGLALCAVALAGCGGGAPSKAQEASASEVPKGSLFVAIKVLKQGTQVLALVPVRIDGKGPYSFALDTGASQSLVDSQVARELRVKKTGKTERFAGASAISTATEIKVQNWSVGRVKLPPTVISEANLPMGNASGGVQGLLGSDMLSQFDIVTIDYDHSRLVLHHRVVVKTGH